MTLPTYSDYPTKTIILPISDVKIKYRPFTAKEEKVLVLHKDDDDSTEKDKLDAIINLISGCTYGKVDPYKLPTADLEYLFLQIRALSKGNISQLLYTCKKSVTVDGVTEDCNNEIQLDIDLNDIKVLIDSGFKKEFECPGNDKIKLFFKCPHASILQEMVESPPENVADGTYMLLFNCMTMATYNEEIYTEFSREEFDTFIDSLPSPVLDDIQDNFIDKVPVLKQHAHIKCDKCGYEEDIMLQGLNDFL